MGEILMSNGTLLAITPEAALIAVNGVMQGGDASRIASALNDRRDVVYSEPKGVFLQTAEGKRICLLPKPPAPGGLWRTFTWQSINNSREVCFMVDLPEKRLGNSESRYIRNFQWRQGSVEEITGKYGLFFTLNGDKEKEHRMACSPRDSNDAGHLTGHLIEAANENERAFLLEGDGIVHSLPPLRGAYRSFGFGLNNHDDVAGYSRFAGWARATLWRDGEPVDLNERIDPRSGWRLHVAQRINDDGIIIGEGVLNGKRAHFALIPEQNQTEATTSVEDSLEAGTKRAGQ